MRKLNTSDLFKFLRIMRKAKIDKEIHDLISSMGDEADEREVGIKAVIGAIMSVPDAECEIYDFIGGVAERDDIAELPLNEFFNILSEIARENDLKSFFGSALRMNGQG
ncbi:MAG: hypothetical protein ACI4DY_09070 [Monoglobaceae bacterium]